MAATKSANRPAWAARIAARAERNGMSVKAPNGVRMTRLAKLEAAR